MSEQYPTQAEYEEQLHEIFAGDPELYNYIVYGEYEELIEEGTIKMRKHEDGSVTLTKSDLAELNAAYKKLYRIVSDMPAFLGDYCKDRAEYLNIEKWVAFLNGEEYDPAEWE